MKTTENDVKASLIIPEELAFERLDAVLAKLLPDYSRTQLRDWIDQGAVLLNDKPTKGSHKVKGGERIEVAATLKVSTPFIPQAIPLNIVYEDDDLLIINKPVGLVVHPGAGNADSTLLNALLHHAPALERLPRAGILHRLDKDTSGLLIVAKTPGALKSLSQQLKKRTIVREYQAIVYGRLISGGMVDAPIDRHPLNRKRMAIVETGKAAITHYRVAEKYFAHTRLNVKLETGRTHQIRVHLSHIHHPLVGDAQYGGRVQLNKGMQPLLIGQLRQFKRQALHAWAIGFTHPTTGKERRWEIPLPEDMEALIAALRDDLKHRKEK